MKEFIDKLIERLEEEKQRLRKLRNNTVTLTDHEVCAIEEGAFNFCKKTVNQLAKEYNKDSCEWKWGLDYAQVQCMGDKILFGTRRIFTYCPYCGKKIKDAPYTEGE